LALAASLGIFWADLHPLSSFSLLVFTILVLFAFVSARSIWTYALVTTGFFVLHSLRTTDTVGRRFVQEVGDQPLSMTAHGVVISEPKISAKGYFSFVLQLADIELAGETRPSHARILVRSRGPAEFGDTLQLFGLVSRIAPPRNPGEFNGRRYLARH